MNRMQTPLGRYAVAILAVSVALFLKFKVSLLVELEGGFLILLAAVTVGAWYGGPGPGLLATALSILFSSRYSPVPMPAQSVMLLHPMPFALFLADGVLISLLAARARGHSPGRMRAPGEAASGDDPLLILEALLARAAHDLRSPLNAILGWVQLGRIQEGFAEDRAIQGRAWDGVEQNARSQLSLLDRLLDAVNVLGGHLKLQQESVNFAVAVAATVETLAPLARERGVSLALSLGDGMLPVWGDEGRLRGLCAELLANAVEATPRDGSVRVSAEQHGAHIVLTVMDTGPGIPPALQPYLFTLERPAAWNCPGPHGRRGLGLVVARRLADLHGGEITVRAGKDGQGACFIARIPIGPPPA